MKRPVLTWAIFALCLAVVLAAMGWITRLVLRLDQAEADASRQATLQENIRLALWRMDSALAPLIAQENARPYFHYSSFYPAERAYGRMFSAVAPGEVLLPSPLLAAPAPNVLLHFQSGPSGSLTSPQAPVGVLRRLAERSGVDRQLLAVAAERLAKLRGIPRQVLLAQLRGNQPAQPALVKAFAPQPKQSVFTLPQPDREMEKQKVLSEKEYAARANQQLALNRDLTFQNSPPGTQKKFLEPHDATPLSDSPNVQPSVVGDAPMQPSWHGDALILARRIWVGPTEYLQGCWLDWPSLRDSLLSSVRDLLPHADLKPLQETGESTPELRLAALPVRLVSGTIGQGNSRPASLLRTSLFVAWAGILLAAIAVGLLLQKAVSLSERRGAFVSAVTHELRTPLTTFRLYTEMLAEGMTTTEADRRDFLQTLRREAERLDHLVKNVLAYARLERHRTPVTLEEVPVSEILDRSGDRLKARATEAGFVLDVLADSETLAFKAWTDPSAVEQILFNLVDNAVKYAASATDRRIEIKAQSNGRRLRLTVRDYGPGLSRAARKKLFKPFSKSAVEAARSAPGVGLGLALSRGLARSLGGDMIHDSHVTPGACFVVRLRAHPRNPRPCG